MSKHPVHDVTVTWVTFGWVAQSPNYPGHSSPCAGPRDAADDLCRKMFGPNPYTLKFKAKGWYQAQLK